MKLKQQTGQVFILSILCLIVVLNACKNQQREERQLHDRVGETEDARLGAMEDVDAIISVTREEVQSILAAYLDVKAALVKTDAAAAAVAARKLPPQVKSLMKDTLLKNISFDVDQIAKSDDIAHQREHFKGLSKNVYQLIAVTRANSKTLYRQFCPMAFDDTGAYWLSAEPEIENPYFGDQMLRCGSVKEKL